MFYFNKEEKDEHDFFISYSQFSCSQFQACSSPRAFLGHLSSCWSRRWGISPESLVNWRQERPRKELNATSDAQFAALPLDKPFARAVVNWRSRSVAKSAISHKTVSTQHGDAIPPNLIGSFGNNDLVSTILRRLNTVYVMTGLSFLK